jgi:Leucine-rich repeat (LRR) protein
MKVKDVAHEPADLGRLDLSDADIQDLGVLSAYPDLVSLRLKGCLKLRDLSALRRTRVEELELDPALDLVSLAGSGIRRLVLAGGNLTDLPVDLPLRSLSVADVPDTEEIQHLSRLALTHLEVRRPKAADLVRLRALTELREIDLHGVEPCDVLPGRLVRFHP